MRRPDAGFTMVEVLVAVLLLAVGLVGALAMQAHAMRSRQESALQTEALQAAAALADRIRANAAQSSSYLGFEFSAGAPGDPRAAPDLCAGAPCDAAALARSELGDFRQLLQARLPAARAVICRDASAVSAASGGQPNWACTDSPGAPIAIKIGWRSHRAAGDVPQSAPHVALAVALPPSPPVAPPVAPHPGPATTPPAALSEAPPVASREGVKP